MPSKINLGQDGQFFSNQIGRTSNSISLTKLKTEINTHQFMDKKVKQFLIATIDSKLTSLGRAVVPVNEIGKPKSIVVQFKPLKK